ncbi:hypothetical protein E6A45_05725 [Brachyspira pilosicoli]|uniref:hypothetical protein n=1 Tax=Brachyspira pilosicoli TaxID=52584 RepID=UPI0012F483E5|nr:hypothetical protein [Brachyspira pilosicoli]MBW5378145.1 hypothetical protein [Brachyspira pilosicoli]MBW5399921.1 hypothetical protein [Brachyspira pilosicoli]
MKKIIKKILIISSITIFIYSCTNNTGVSKYQGTYRGSVNTTLGSERQLIVNTATVTINANDSINVMMEGGNIYDKNVDIAKEELTRVNDDTYNAQKDGNSYTFTFYNDYMNLNIHNTDNYITDGQLPKAQ